MTNKKKKGFTIVELVIVIAVIAVLAAVLIPTFTGVIDKANESADIQAVRQMNIALAVESIEETPEEWEIADVIGILAAAGFNSTDKLVPVSANHGFYWCKAANLITLIRDEGENIPELIFPTDEEKINTAFTTAEANWGTAITGENATFFDLEPAGEAAGLPTGGSGGEGSGETPTGTALTADNLDALASGGEFYLSGDLTISQAIGISADTTINLNGQTLTLDNFEGEYSSPLSVSSSLTIKDSVGGTGELVIEGPGDSETENAQCCGIHVYDTGVFKLENITITGEKEWCIENYGDITLTNSKYYVESGYGVSNAGTAVLENTEITLNGKGSYGFNNQGGNSTIKNCTFVSNGEDVTPVYCMGGDVTITKTTTGTGTTFSEGDNFVSYMEKAPIEVYNGTATLNSVTVTLKETTISAAETAGTELCCVYAGSSGTVTIESGTFNYLLGCTHDGYASITIQDGEINGIACADIDEIYKNQIVIAGNLTLTQDEDGYWVIS